MVATDVPGPRLLGLSAQDPWSPTALSGVPRHLLDALDGPCEVVGRVAFGAAGAQRLLLAAATVRPDRAAWRARFREGPLSERVHRRTLARRLAAVPPFDVALQVFGAVTGQPRPYALYLDQTRLMAERGWPDWMPMRPGERAGVLRREAATYRSAAHLFTMGAAARDSLVADYGVPPGRITVVGGGVNFDPLPAPSPVPREPSVLFVGRDWERKGGPDLLSAFRRVRERVPRARLEVVGPRLRIRDPGVTVHGRLGGRAALAALYRGTRVFCLPSRYEPWGLAFAEAMAHGRPCVGTRVQAVPEILGHGGVLVAPADPEALAGALEVLLTDDEAAARLGAAARSRAEDRLTWGHVAGRMLPALTAAARS